MVSKILVAEDENIMVRLLENTLTQNGYEVRVVSNGQEGLQAVRENKPDLIISDVMMPVMDGFAFCRELEADENMSDIPVLILTGKSQMEDSFSALGVDDFISKPFEPEALLLKVSQLLKDSGTKE